MNEQQITVIQAEEWMDKLAGSNGDEKTLRDADALLCEVLNALGYTSLVEAYHRVYVT